ncbi:DNA internalization-related competence protein ComEC/Rec2 [Halomonas halocynthiae]|uniref:DNA internalization-related competence protein ComEC/Rec2 n=1 Tax=Halomonas halocynthiae TaxID=176290 RepID=UPI00041EE8E0|nr:DNA internalization-related competence protein ComEC/Rec2 [Halomonas halocynthiae]
MRYGVAFPLAMTSLAGVVTGVLADTALLQVVVVLGVLSIACRRWTAAVAVVVILLVALRLLAMDGAELPQGLNRQNLSLDARLVSVEKKGRITRMTVVVERCQPQDTSLPACDGLKRIRLNLYQPLPLVAGERWRFTVRLRAPSGMHNPGAFNYRAWLHREGIHATGYVRQAPEPVKLSQHRGSFRQTAQTYLNQQPLSLLGRRWLAALTLGDGDQLDRTDWERLNATGTTHLVVISGLHVALVAGLALWLARRMARVVMPADWRMTPWPWWLAGVAALAFGVLSGLEPPALRAVIMTLLGLWVASGRHAPGAWQAWWLALALVLLFDPLSAWRPGLWLSFVAVAALILAWQGRPKPAGIYGWLWALLRTQCLLAPLMAAAVLLAFGRLAPAAPLVNLLAVPVVGSLMVPLGLVGWLVNEVPLVGGLPWQLFDLLAQATNAGLAQAADGLPLWHVPLAWRIPLAAGCGLLGLSWLLPGLHGVFRWAVSAMLIVLLVLLQPDRPDVGRVQVQVYDVGQGQMVSLQTASYRLLVDAGPRYTSGFMPLDSVWSGPQAFDDVMISHDDQDHAGGVLSLKQRHQVGRYLAPVGSALPVAFTQCVAGQYWQRDGVSFRVLWPPSNAVGLSGNDNSCVLLVSAGLQHVLITGDAGASVEQQLLDELPGMLAVLVAGHHGSNTSSSAPFVAATRPRVVIFSAGAGNAYGHPASQVVRLFRHYKSCQFNTANDGAVRLTLGGDEGGMQLHTTRVTRLLRAVEHDCLAVESATVKIDSWR